MSGSCWYFKIVCSIGLTEPASHISRNLLWMLSWFPLHKHCPNVWLLKGQAFCSCRGLKHVFFWSNSSDADLAQAGFQIICKLLSCWGALALFLEFPSEETNVPGAAHRYRAMLGERKRGLFSGVASRAVAGMWPGRMRMKTPQGTPGGMNSPSQVRNQALRGQEESRSRGLVGSARGCRGLVELLLLSTPEAGQGLSSQIWLRPDWGCCEPTKINPSARCPSFTRHHVMCLHIMMGLSSWLQHEKFSQNRHCFSYAAYELWKVQHTTCLSIHFVCVTSHGKFGKFRQVNWQVPVVLEGMWEVFRWDNPGSGNDTACRTAKTQLSPIWP